MPSMELEMETETYMGSLRGRGECPFRKSLQIRPHPDNQAQFTGSARRCLKNDEIDNNGGRPPFLHLSLSLLPYQRPSCVWVCGTCLTTQHTPPKAWLATIPLGMPSQGGPENKGTRDLTTICWSACPHVCLCVSNVLFRLFLSL